MKHLFLVREKSGDPMSYTLPVKTSNKTLGEPTKKARLILNNYPMWVNITTTIDDPRYGWGDKILKDFAG